MVAELVEVTHGKIDIKQTPRKVFLEVGTGEMPVPGTGTRFFPQEEIYLGVDKVASLVQKARDKSDKRPNINFAVSRGQSLPLAMDSIDEIFLGNVLAEINSNVRDIEQKKKEIRELLDETQRVLRKKGGLLTILETNTPTNITIVEEVLQKCGFNIYKIITAADKSWEPEVAIFAARSGNAIRKNMMRTPDKYLLFAKSTDGSKSDY